MKVLILLLFLSINICLCYECDKELNKLWQKEMGGMSPDIGWANYQASLIAYGFTMGVCYTNEGKGIQLTYEQNHKNFTAARVVWTEKFLRQQRQDSQ